MPEKGGGLETAFAQRFRVAHCIVAATGVDGIAAGRGVTAEHRQQDSTSRGSMCCVCASGVCVYARAVCVRAYMCAHTHTPRTHIHTQHQHTHIHTQVIFYSSLGSSANWEAVRSACTKAVREACILIVNAHSTIRALMDTTGFRYVST